MNKIKKIYIDSRSKTSDNVSNNNFKFEIKEAIDLPSNTVCYIDDIAIPHSWYSIEDLHNKIYIQRVYGGTRIDGTIITIPVGNYNASRLASVIQDLLQTRYRNPNYPDDDMTCTYEITRGKLHISASFPFK